MMMRYVFVILFLTLAACGENPPVPVDHFYRLELQHQPSTSGRITGGTIYVSSFEAEGIYNERAILFSEDNNRVLKQYHYHFWSSPPPEMLRSYLVDYLRGSGAASMVVNDFSLNEGLSISGLVQGFEKRTGNDQVSIHVAIELRADRIGEEPPKLIKQYVVDQKIDSSNLDDIVAGFNSAVDSIYDSFLGDLKVAVTE